MKRNVPSVSPLGDVLAQGQASIGGMFGGPIEKRTKLNLNEFRYPFFAEPRPGKRTFETRVVPAETFAVTERLMTVIRPNMKAEMANTRVFQEFVRLNQRIDLAGVRTPMDCLLMLWTVDLLRQELEPSSLETYVGHVLKLYERMGTPIKGCLVGDTKKILAEMKCERDYNHARDITVAEGLDIFEKLSGPAKVTAWFQLNFGTRVGDGNRVSREQMRIEPGDAMNPLGYATIWFRLMKNRRCVQNRYSVRLPLITICPHEVIAALSIGAKEIMSTMEVDAYNKCLKAVCPEVAKLTSYSFRRLFVHRMMERCKSDDGIIDWLEVIHLTGHLKVETARTSYSTPFQMNL